MVTSEAYLTTENGSKYLQQLRKHFGHKTEVEVTPKEGRVKLRAGVARLKADDAGLWGQVETDKAEDIPGLQNVIDRHLERFAFRETLKTMPWPQV